VAPVAGASDKVVAKCEPVQGKDKDGKPLPFTYGGSVPKIPADMHGLWCDRALGGVYGNGQTDLAYQPLTDRYGRAIVYSAPNPNNGESLRTMEYRAAVQRMSDAGTPVKCAVNDTGRKGTSIAPESAVTPQYLYSYPRVESCYNR
jgi:hypothetical protein